jgi:serine O-acetyltransferase
MAALDGGAGQGPAWQSDLTALSRAPTFGSAVYAWIFSPGFKAITLYRLSHSVRRFGPVGKLLSNALWRWNVHSTGCYLSPLAVIGRGFLLPHAIGVVIGEGVRIGEGVTVYQHSTLGTAGHKQFGYPEVEDGVTIYAGAVLAGAILIGAKAVIGANAVVLRSVPSGATSVGVPARNVG